MNPAFQTDRSPGANMAKDAMWAFLMERGQPPNVGALKGYVNDLITMTAQKTAGQSKYKASWHIDWQELDPTLWSIVIEATALVLSGELDKLEDDTK